MQLFDLLHDYQHLRAKAALVALEPSEAVRLEGLEALLGGGPAHDERRRATRFGFPRALPVHVVPKGHGGFVPAQLRELGAEGASLFLDEPLTQDERVLLCFDDEERSLRFEMPAVLVWQHDGQAGIRFEGMPARRKLTDSIRAA